MDTGSEKADVVKMEESIPKEGDLSNVSVPVATVTATLTPTEIATEIKPEPATEVATETKLESETVLEPAIESATEVKPEPTTESAAEGKLEPETVSEPAIESATETQPEPTTEIATETKVEPETVTATAIVTATDIATEIKLETQPEASQLMDVVEDVPDPDEDDLDDLDDLDDMLNEFSATKLDQNSSSTPARTTGSAKPEPSPKPAAPAAAVPSGLDDDFSEEFAKQLQAGMADLLGELEKSPEMQAQFEDMFKQMSEEVSTGEQTTSTSFPGATPSAAPSASSPSKPSAAGTASAAGDDLSFQETIRRTMERMQSSGDQATAAAASGNTDDFMAEMLKQMSSGDFGGEGGDEDFSKMLMGMMEQLTNKEILYEPMKELHDKFPEWLIKNKSSTSADDLKRYEEQRTVVAEIVAKFDEPTYSDANAADREYIVERMQKMQAAGSPPSDLVGDMASAQEAFNTTDDQCNPQ